MLKFLFAKPNSETSGSAWLDVPDGAEVFSYHQKNSGRVLLGGLLMAALVEAIAIHFLLAMWNHWIAWAATLATFWFCLQVISQIRAMGLRPMYIHQGSVMIRNGAFDLVEISLAQVVTIEESMRDFKPESDELKPLNAGFPAGHNVIMKLKQSAEALILNRTKKEFQVVLIAVDEPSRFVDLIRNHSSDQTKDGTQGEPGEHSR